MTYEKEVAALARYNAFARNGLDTEKAKEAEKLKGIWPSYSNPFVHSQDVLTAANAAINKTEHAKIPSKPGNPLPIINPYGTRDIVTHIGDKTGAYHGTKDETPEKEGSVMKKKNGDVRGDLV